MKTYVVTVIPKNPAYNDRGNSFNIDAANKAAAISQARKRVRFEMLYDRHDGPLEYRCVEGDE